MNRQQVYGVLSNDILVGVSDDNMCRAYAVALKLEDYVACERLEREMLSRGDDSWSKFLARDFNREFWLNN